MALLGPQLENRPAAGVEQAAELRHRRGVHEVLRIAEGDARPGNRLEHRIGVGQRRRQHRVPGLGRVAERAGQRLLHDDVLAGPGGRDRHLMVNIRGRADVDDVDVRRFDELSVVREDVRDRMTLGEPFGLLPRAGADRRQRGPRAEKRPVVRRVQLGREPGPDDADAQRGHARRPLPVAHGRAAGGRPTEAWRYFRRTGPRRISKRAIGRSARSSANRVRLAPWW